MVIQEVSRQFANLQLTEDELIVLNNALNEVCNGLELDEFETRMGASKEEARALLNAIGNVIDQLLAG